nr:vegetative cell wall protein gp1-like [Penaeus vannamei]
MSPCDPSGSTPPAPSTSPPLAAHLQPPSTIPPLAAHPSPPPPPSSNSPSTNDASITLPTLLPPTPLHHPPLTAFHQRPSTPLHTPLTAFTTSTTPPLTALPPTAPPPPSPTAHSPTPSTTPPPPSPNSSSTNAPSTSTPPPPPPPRDADEGQPSLKRHLSATRPPTDPLAFAAGTQCHKVPRFPVVMRALRVPIWWHREHKMTSDLHRMPRNYQETICYRHTSLSDHTASSKTNEAVLKARFPRAGNIPTLLVFFPRSAQFQLAPFCGRMLRGSHPGSHGRSSIWGTRRGIKNNNRTKTKQPTKAVNRRSIHQKITCEDPRSMNKTH